MFVASRQSSKIATNRRPCRGLCRKRKNLKHTQSDQDTDLSTSRPSRQVVPTGQGRHLDSLDTRPTGMTPVISGRPSLPKSPIVGRPAISLMQLSENRMRVQPNRPSQLDQSHHESSLNGTQCYIYMLTLLWCT